MQASFVELALASDFVVDLREMSFCNTLKFVQRHHGASTQVRLRPGGLMALGGMRGS